MTLPDKPTEVGAPVDAPFRTRAHSLINKAAIRQFALDWARHTRHWNPERVDQAVYDGANAVVRAYLRGLVARHPSVGKTLRG